MRPKTITTTALIILFLCGISSVTSGSAAAAGPGPHARAKALESLYLREGPSLALSTVYGSLPDEQRYALMARLKAMLTSHLPPDILDHPALDQLSPEARKALETILALATAATPEQMDAFVQQQDLDHLAPLPTEVYRLYHEKAMADPNPETGSPRSARIAADRADPSSWLPAALAAPGYVNTADPPMTELVFLGAGEAPPPDEVPRDSLQPAFDGLGVKTSFVVRAPKTALVNSLRLARALNHLTNPAYEDQPLILRTRGKAWPVRSGVELFNRLMATGAYEAVLFDARMFVDFVHLSVMHGDEAIPVRIPTWVLTDVNPASPMTVAAAGTPRLIVPANHSEHLLALYDKETGSLQAMVKWYMGIPGGEGLGQGTLFKAAVWERSSWCGYRIVRTYGATADIRLFLRSACRLMRLFNFCQLRHHYPKNGYAVLAVCNDTTGLMEAILQGGDSTVWPLVRDPALDFYYAAQLDVLGLSLVDGAGGMKVLNVVADARPDHYPQVGDRTFLLRRMGANIPTRRLGNLHFPLLKEGLEALAAGAAPFRRSLKLLD